MPTHIFKGKMALELDNMENELEKHEKGKVRTGIVSFSFLKREVA